MKIYANILCTNREEKSVLASIVKRCQNVKNLGAVERLNLQNDWSQLIKNEVSSIAEVNPYLQNLPEGTVISAAEAASWDPALRPNLDCKTPSFRFHLKYLETM